MTHHFINRRLVVPIPELWMVLAALLVAKGIKLQLEQRKVSPRLLLATISSSTLLYSIVTWQIYITGAILACLAAAINSNLGLFNTFNKSK